MGQDSSVCMEPLATGWTVWGSNPGEGEIFRIRPDRPWVSSNLPYSTYRISCPEVKQPERSVNHLFPSTAEVKERVEIFIYSSVPSWLVLGRIVFRYNHRTVTRIQFLGSEMNNRRSLFRFSVDAKVLMFETSRLAHVQ
jgi:hypothetical protein